MPPSVRAVEGNGLYRDGNANRQPVVSDGEGDFAMIKKITGGYRLYSRKKNPKTGRRRNLGTFTSLAAAKKHERAVQYFKRH